MRVVIALLIVIVLILLGLFTPMILGLGLALVTVAPELLTVAGLFVVVLIGTLIYHASQGNL